MNTRPEYLCHLSATDDATCVSGKGETREQAVARAVQQRAQFAEAIGALIEGTHGEDNA